jgi:hypothetical protein
MADPQQTGAAAQPAPGGGHVQGELQKKEVAWITRNILNIEFTVLIGYGLGALALIIMLVACFYAADSGWIHVLLLVFGMLLGWVVGILITPQSAEEKTQFSAYGAAISTFLSGYVVAKIDKLFESGAEKGLLTDAMLVRCLIFGSAFLLGLLCTFVGRMYLPKQSELVTKSAPADASKASGS